MPQPALGHAVRGHVGVGQQTSRLPPMSGRTQNRLNRARLQRGCQTWPPCVSTRICQSLAELRGFRLTWWSLAMLGARGENSSLPYASPMASRRSQSGMVKVRKAWVWSKIEKAPGNTSVHSLQAELRIQQF